MSAFSHVSEVDVLQIWDGVNARAVTGDQATFAYIVLDPDAAVPEHHHPNEQTGILLRGSLRFRIGDETKELRPGAMWVIPGDVPHEVTAGAEGAALAELFAPARGDWGGLERSPGAAPDGF